MISVSNFGHVQVRVATSPNLITDHVQGCNWYCRPR